jgi:hypothetical protein
VRGEANPTHSAAEAAYCLTTCCPARPPAACDFVTISRKSTQFSSRTGVQRKADKCLLYYSLSLFLPLLPSIPLTSQLSAYPSPQTMQSFPSSPSSSFPPPLLCSCYHGFPTKTLCALLFYPISVTCTAHRILFNLIIPIRSGEEYKLRSSSLRSFLKSLPISTPWL